MLTEWQLDICICCISRILLLWWCYVIWYIFISNRNWFKGKWKLFREGKKMVKEDIATIDLSLDTSDASRWFFCDFFEFAEPVFFPLAKGNRKTKYWTDAICVSYTISKLHKINSNVPNLCFECRYYIYYSFLALPVHLCTCYFFFFCCSALDSQQLVIAVSNMSRKNRYKCVNRQWNIIYFHVLPTLPIHFHKIIKN